MSTSRTWGVVLRRKRTWGLRFLCQYRLAPCTYPKCRRVWLGTSGAKFTRVVCLRGLSGSFLRHSSTTFPCGHYNESKGTCCDACCSWKRWTCRREKHRIPGGWSGQHSGFALKRRYRRQPSQGLEGGKKQLKHYLCLQDHLEVSPRLTPPRLTSNMVLKTRGCTKGVPGDGTSSPCFEIMPFLGPLTSHVCSPGATPMGRNDWFSKPKWDVFKRHS